MARCSNGESVLSRVLRILELFDSRAPTLTVSTLARRSGLPLPTVSRLVGEMVGQGLLERTEDRRVRTGITLWELACRAAPTLGLRDVAMPFMEDLHAVVGHHVQLAVLQERDVLIVERLSSPGAVHNISRIAGRLPRDAAARHMCTTRLRWVTPCPWGVPATTSPWHRVAPTCLSPAGSESPPSCR